MAQLREYVGEGLFTTSEAARLIGVTTDAVRRWAFGYRRAGNEYPPVVRTQLPKLEDRYALTFVEFVELFSVKELLDLDVSLPKVREALGTARRLLEVEHPFAMQRWFADPAGIFVELARRDEEDVLIELVGHGQVAMSEPLSQYLEQLEFGEDELAERWYPLGPDGPIVVDPRRAFGMPTVRGTATRTEALFRAYQGGAEAERLADEFGLETEKVEAAVEFELALAA